MSSNHDVWGGRPWVGFLEFTFQGDRFSLEIHEPQDMINMDLRDWTRDDGPGDLDPDRADLRSCEDR